ncbi:TetR/AcrR family transcriptional regulator [Paenibacillus fonticola]|uniref:TetR/AcrR family transcriptional regulator n=1 Tax=Paenibacillus fonticola TaxID=379896 RepID=UPI0003748808|nr:TetR/AcrR family transcriptional regulator [Paenibacillus fonticola]
MDKRKQKSQKVIMDAFLELLKDKELDKISMNDIAEKANVNRGTIYLNFIDKYDLLDKCIESNFSQMIEESRSIMHDKKKLNKDSLLFIFKYLENHFDFLRILFKNVGFSVFKKCIYDEMVIALQRYYQSKNDTNVIQSEISIQFLASAVTGVLEWWFVNSMPCSSEQITDKLWALLQTNHYH